MTIKKLNIIIFFALISVLFISCKGQILPPEKFVFDSKFDSLYKAISHNDTILFENSRNSIDTFVLTKTDSAISDHINCFMCPRAAKTIFRNYKQYPINFWIESRLENQGKSNEKTTEREIPLISITKYPDSNINEAYVSFKNFHCTMKGTLGMLFTDTLKINNSYFTNYYLLNSTAKSLIANKDDVESIFITLKEGIIAYKEKSGILRKRYF